MQMHSCYQICTSGISNVLRRIELTVVRSSSKQPVRTCLRACVRGGRGGWGVGGGVKGGGGTLAFPEVAVATAEAIASAVALAMAWATTLLDTEPLPDEPTYRHIQLYGLPQLEQYCAACRVIENTGFATFDGLNSRLDIFGVPLCAVLFACGMVAAAVTDHRLTLDLHLAAGRRERCGDSSANSCGCG